MNLFLWKNDALLRLTDLITVITNNPKNLDLGGLLVTLSHLFMDLRFISRIKEEFIRQELNKDLIKELERLDSI
ncbi:MAG: hypothetical protein SO161_04845 [Treponema sp.]|nr:hypothetical protein [Treponema sp.]